MAEIPQVAVGAVQFYRSRGISKDSAVAIVAVLWYESKLRPGSQGSQSTEVPGTLNPGGAYGIASWNGPRQAVLASFAQKKGLNVGDLDTQLAFVLTEMANSYPKSWAAIMSPALGYAEIIPVIVAEYENPKDHQAEINGAMVFAPQLYGVIPQVAPVVQPIPQPLTGVTTLPPIDPAILAALVQVLAPIVESALAGLVKAIVQQIGGAKAGAGQLPLPLPGFDPTTLASLIAKELATLQGAQK